jgi:hypothetical protein
MNIKGYYSGSFVGDLDTVIGTNMPRFFGGTWRRKGCPELGKVAKEWRPHFVACLYYSVLIDQALCQHAHKIHKDSRLFEQYPKFNRGPDPDKGNMNPRVILRYPMYVGLVSSDDLTSLAKPAANLFIAELVETVEKLLPRVNLSNFFCRLENWPRDGYVGPSDVRKFRNEIRVEERFWAEMLSACRTRRRGTPRT